MEPSSESVLSHPCSRYLCDLDNSLRFSSLQNLFENVKVPFNKWKLEPKRFFGVLKEELKILIKNTEF